MVFEFLRGGKDRQLEDIERRIIGMLIDCKHAFELAFDSLLDGDDPMAVGEEVRDTDRRVNKAERAVRRELIVHVSVRGDRANLPGVLASMSVAKDAERIGDYAKNIWDLAAEGVSFSNDPDRDDLEQWRHSVSQAITDVAAIFTERDSDAARSAISEYDAIQDRFDALISEQLASDAPAGHAVPRALLYRYLKRVVAHLMNMLTSLVMPIDRLDFYDEKKEDRE